MLSLFRKIGFSRISIPPKRRSIPAFYIIGTILSCTESLLTQKKFHIMANQIPRGAFIVFEGCDRAGKSTQARKLVDTLNANNITTQYVNFPDRTTATGQIINEYLLKKVELSDQAAHLLFSANRWEREPVLKKLLAQGTTLVCDRYSFSGVAFSAAKEGMDINWCFEPEKGLPKPDAVLLFKLNEEALSKREGFGDERYEQTDFQRRVAENYEQLKDSTWIDIDADRDIDTLGLLVKDIVVDVIKKAQFCPLKRFV